MTSSLSSRRFAGATQTQRSDGRTAEPGLERRNLGRDGCRRVLTPRSSTSCCSRRAGSCAARGALSALDGRRTLQRASRSDPLHRLTCDRGNPIVIFIIVQHGRLRSFRRRRDEQVRYLDAAMVEAAAVGEPSLNFECSPEGRGIGGDRVPEPLAGDLGMSCVMPGAGVDTEERHRCGRLSPRSSGDRSIPEPVTMRPASRSRRWRRTAS